MQKISALDDGQKDFNEIFNNLDEYIKNNSKPKINIDEDEGKEDLITKAINNNSNNHINNQNYPEPKESQNEYQKANNEYNKIIVII